MFLFALWAFVFRVSVSRFFCSYVIFDLPYLVLILLCLTWPTVIMVFEMCHYLAAVHISVRIHRQVTWSFVVDVWCSWRRFAMQLWCHSFLLIRGLADLVVWSPFLGCSNVNVSMSQSCSFSVLSRFMVYFCQSIPFQYKSPLVTFNDSVDAPSRFLIFIASAKS